MIKFLKLTTSKILQGSMLVQLKKNLVLLGLLVCSAAWSGCSTVQYYGQAIEGQFRILLKRKPISEIMADPESPELLNQRFEYILAVREFAETELLLPVNHHYLTYVDLKRSFVAWNVFATPELSMEPKTWCYPFVGCAAYRGYFSEANAVQYADSLRRQGYDVYVGGVTAYSTLGWFDDPVLNTFVRLSKARLAALLFHELAHQLLYVPNDTAFNESFATFVEQEALLRWQRATGNSSFFNDYLDQYHRQQQFIGLILQYRQTLESLYQTNLSPDKKRENKAAIFSELRNEFNRMKTRQIELSVYDDWMNRPLNNAKITSVAAYHDFVPAFRKLLAQNDMDLNRFYSACRQLAKKSKANRHRILRALINTEFDQAERSCSDSILTAKINFF
jgi:predicted aminopeptidase